ncbi:MAG: DNA polymerase I, partial [Planctomycetes bacterium]|nr:DNA polymerase I [Planctomycetota bacterium]
MAASKRLFLIDGSALAYRAYFAFVRNPLINRKGMNTSAIYGFTNSLLKLIEAEKPDYLAVVFDSPEPTFRHQMYPEYKATREKMPDDMAAQLPYLDQVVKAFNIPQLVRPGVEADDVIGTLATRAAREGFEAFMVTADKDFLQLVTDKVKVYNNTKKGDEIEILDPAGVEAKFGVPPAQVVDVLGLMGDTSDNIPGVEGVGEKSALELVKRFGSLEAALDHADEVTAKRVREGLKKGREDALKSKKLVTIDTNVPLDVKLEDLRPGQPDSAELVRLFQFFEFDSLIDRIRVAQAPHEVSYHLVSDEKTFSHLLNLLKSADSFVFDLETTSLNPIDAEIVGLSFAVREREAFYVPVSPAKTAAASTGLFDAPRSSLDQVIERLKPIFESETPRKGGQNVKYDMLVLRNYGIEVRGLAFDTMVASYLLDPSQRQ